MLRELVRRALDGEPVDDPEVLLFFDLESLGWRHLPHAGGVLDQPAWLWAKLTAIRALKLELDAARAETPAGKEVSDSLEWLRGLPAGADGEGR